MLAWALSASHLADFREENWLFTKGLGRVLYDGVYIWVIYVALEPFIRRQWPETIVSWTRLLSGRFRDPLVGRHVLFGAAFGVALAVVEGVGHIAPTWFGWPTDTPPSVDLTTLEGPWRIAAEFLRSLYWHLEDPFYFIFLLVLIRFVVRKLWIAMVLFGLVITVAGSLTAEPFPVAFVTLAVWISLGLFCIVKFGFVGTISAHFFGTLGSTFPLTLDTSAWYWDASLAGLLVGAAGVLFAFHVSLAGKPLFRDAPIATG
jgi:serine/threonine-protein kinase